MAKKEKMSFKGWSFVEWLKGNQKTIKEVLKVGFPLMASWLATNDPMMSGFATLVGKFLLDSVEYWVKPRTK